MNRISIEFDEAHAPAIYNALSRCLRKAGDEVGAEVAAEAAEEFRRSAADAERIRRAQAVADKAEVSVEVVRAEIARRDKGDAAVARRQRHKLPQELQVVHTLLDGR